ncbi:DCC1-like thiol-disulfide oxidoreductase family protein [Polymorphospora sp. NPDC050346]|uniref:thiol-disulfide oxidoreductase DCC family protein n=1 Tax=Polymorphospora sp. NPDC050346 TaxID=3155780 RepID=UPI00340963E1
MTGARPGDPTAHGGGGIAGFTVLYDERCPVCRTARAWLAARDQLVPLSFVPAGSPQARLLFPDLDHAATLRDISVIADTGEVYVGDGAWLACLWALADYRALADRLARPDLLPVARRVVKTASALRERYREPYYGGDDERSECADDRCG